MDILKYNARDILKYNKKFSQDTLKIWKMVNWSVRAYYELFFDFSFRKVSALSKNRDETKQMPAKKAKTIPSEELLYLTSHKQILEIILDLTDFRSGLE